MRTASAIAAAGCLLAVGQTSPAEMRLVQLDFGAAG